MGAKDVKQDVKSTVTNTTEKAKVKISNMQEYLGDNMPGILAKAMSMPGVYIDREKYLRKELSKYYSEEQVQKAIDTTPALAGIPLKMSDRIAKNAQKIETTKTTFAAVAAGIPGGFAMAATIPADLAQYFGHLLRVMQKVAYIYGWPQFDVRPDGGEIDDGTMNMLILFVGMAFGVATAKNVIQKVAAALSKTLAKTLVNKALTKGVVYPIVKKVASLIGIHMTKEIFAKSASKIVPVVGGVVNGGLVLASFQVCCHRLKKEVRSTPLATNTTPPENSGETVIDITEDLIDSDDLEEAKEFEDELNNAVEETTASE